MSHARPELVVGVFCIDDQDRVCLLRTHKEPEFFKPPGGHVERETVEACCARELREETGTTARYYRYLGWGEVIADRHLVYFNYSCKTSDPRTTPLKPEEVLEVLWLPVEDAMTNPRVHPRVRDEIRLYFA